MTRSRHTPRLVSLALLAGIGGACGVAGDEVDAAGGANDARLSPSALTLQAGPGFLHLMPDAPLLTLHRGTRRVYREFSVGGQSCVISYLEDVACDGAGKFQIVPLEVISSGLTDLEKELLLLKQTNRAGHSLHYRDFRVRDVESFLRSYVVVIEDGGELVAGVECVRMRAERRDHPEFYYLAWIDPRTGLVLCSEQRTFQGALLAQVEYLSIDYQPDLAGLELRGDLYAETALDLVPDLSDQAGFTTLEPQLLPTGYRFESAVLFSDENGLKWLRREYGDGCEVLSFLQSAPVADSGPSPAWLDELELGGWALFAGEIHRCRVIAMGRMRGREVIQFLQSCRYGD